MSKGKMKWKIIGSCICGTLLLGLGILWISVFWPQSAVAQTVARLCSLPVTDEGAISFLNKMAFFQYTDLKSGGVTAVNSALSDQEEHPVQNVEPPENGEDSDQELPGLGIGDLDSQKEPLPPTPTPGPPGTPLKPYYDEAGNPPTAPGLAMRQRNFKEETGKVAYLTFDDGPYPETTSRILDILARENVQATFFMIGSQAECYPDLVKAVYQQGHGIGNHSYSHLINKIYKNPQIFLDDIKVAEEVIYNIVGVRPQVVRAPGGTLGHFNIGFYNAVDAEGYLMMDWNVDPGDTSARVVPRDKIINKVRQQIEGKDRAVILLHDLVGKDTTIEALPTIIQDLRSRGFSFGVLDAEVMPILFESGLKS